MKKCYPHAGIALAVAALLAGVSAINAYAVPETAESGTETAAEESSSTLWKAEISDYDSSLSLVQYEEVKPTEEQVTAIEQATAPKAAASSASVELASSDAAGNANVGAAAALGTAGRSVCIYHLWIWTLRRHEPERCKLLCNLWRL